MIWYVKNSVLLTVLITTLKKFKQTNTCSRYVRIKEFIKLCDSKKAGRATAGWVESKETNYLK